MWLYRKCPCSQVIRAEVFLGKVHDVYNLFELLKNICMIDSWRERGRERTRPNWQTVGKSRSRIYRCPWVLFSPNFPAVGISQRYLFLSGRLVQRKLSLWQEKKKSLSMYLTSHLSEECTASHSQKITSGPDTNHQIASIAYLLLFSRSAWRG